MHTRLLGRAVSALLTVAVLATCQLPAAAAAGIPDGRSAVTPVIITSSGFCPHGSGAGSRVLCRLGIRVSRVSQASSFVACLGCNGGWSRWSKSGQTWMARAAKPITRAGTVVLVVTKPGYIGRYRLYRAAALGTSRAGLHLYRQGCLGAGIPASTIRQSLAGRLRNLPTVPCVRPRGLTGNAFTAGTNELSTTTITHALAYGKVSQPMWLTMGETSSGNCRPGGPYAYTAAERHRILWYSWRVNKGYFDSGFRLKARLPAGQICIYLQSGVLYHGFADGPVAQWGYTDYSTGDVLTGPAATALTAAGSTTVTLTGHAPRAEILQSYDSLTPCPEYSEYLQTSSFGGSTMQVSGDFTTTLTTASFSQSGYVCSYLHDGAITVAMSTDLVTVAGTQFKDQTSYAETAAQAIGTVSNPIGDTGTVGAGIAAGQTVQVRCIVNGQGQAPYDPVWYEVASSPWADAYYAPSYAFYNNGQTSGTVVHGRIWDPAVPFCNAA